VAAEPVRHTDRRNDRGNDRAGHEDHRRPAHTAVKGLDEVTTACSRGCKHGYVRCCRDATLWCPRPELNPNYMIVMKAELSLP
jgi:hypothetical protein